jgi:transcriptional regulator with XRE-family HTH domain
MDQLFKTRVSALVKELRGECSQAAFGELIGLSQSAISDYEKGKRLPDNDAMEKIAAYCNLLPEQLIAKFYGRLYVEPEPGAIIAPPTPQLTIDEQIRQMGLVDKVRLQSKLSQAIERDVCG